MESNAVAIHVTLELDRQYYDRTGTYVIAQQYSYCTLKSNSLSFAPEITA